MKQKSFTTLLITLLVLGGVIIGTFAGGIALGKSQGQEQASQNMQSLIASRFSGNNQTGNSTNSNSSQSAIPGGFPGRLGRGTFGTVTSVEDDVITVETMQGSMSVVISDDTSIQKMDDGSVNDILPGEYITVSGDEGEDGSVQASSVYLIPQGLQAP